MSFNLLKLLNPDRATSVSILSVTVEDIEYRLLSFKRSQ